MTRAVADVLEDLDFLDSTLVGATEAAKRADFTSAEAMEKWLERHDRYDLWARDPKGMHHYTKARRTMSAVPTPIDTVATLLADASQSTRARTRSKSARVAAMLDDLRAILTAEREDDRIRESARKEVEKLERQLAEAKARLRGGVGPHRRRSQRLRCGPACVGQAKRRRLPADGPRASHRPRGIRGRPGAGGVMTANNPDPWLDETTEDFVWPGDVVAADETAGWDWLYDHALELSADAIWFGAEVLADIDELGGGAS